MKYKILFTSKNNHDLLENWIEKNSLINTPSMINLDLNSEYNQQQKGRKICSKHDIDFLIADYTEFQMNIKQAFDYISKLGFDYLLYLHHDCFPAKANTFSQINNCILKNNLSYYGCIGFNIYHDIEIKHFDGSLNQYMTTSRCVLQKGNGYYMKHPKGSRVNYNKFKKGLAFSVENVMWTALLLSSKSFYENIKVDKQFNFFLAPDDMAYQFLSKGIQNIVIPEINFLHDQSIKTQYNLPKDSPIGKKEDVELRYGKFIGIHEIWFKKWGFRYDPKKVLTIFNYRIVKFLMLKFLPSYYSGLDTIARKSYKESKSQNYSFDSFYNHDPAKGPLNYIKIKI
ncbi:MAG: hypothetical protein HN595_00640 [Flavobacteriaceae bacterium]|nr:hypothetical protein [Flavobacteriaceae bacterium]